MVFDGRKEAKRRKLETQDCSSSPGRSWLFYAFRKGLCPERLSASRAGAGAGGGGVHALDRFAALAVDLGVIYSARAELQRTADAAALAGATGLASDALLAKKDDEVSAKVRARCSEMAQKNTVLGKPSRIEPEDIEFGVIAVPSDFSSPFVPSAPSAANAVRVTVRRTEGSADGPLPVFFAQVFGKRSASVIATATAVLDDRFPPTRQVIRCRRC